MATQQPSVDTSEDGSLRGIAPRVGVVWRLAIDTGLTPEQAEDVCFVTLRETIADPRRIHALDRQHAGWLLRTAVEQCAVARAVAARLSRESQPTSPSRRTR